MDADQKRKKQDPPEIRKWEDLEEGLDEKTEIPFPKSRRDYEAAKKAQRIEGTIIGSDNSRTAYDRNLQRSRARKARQAQAGANPPGSSSVDPPSELDRIESGGEESSNSNGGHNPDRGEPPAVLVEARIVEEPSLVQAEPLPVWEQRADQSSGSEGYINSDTVSRKWLFGAGFSLLVALLAIGILIGVLFGVSSPPDDPLQDSDSDESQSQLPIPTSTQPTLPPTRLPPPEQPQTATPIDAATPPSSFPSTELGGYQQTADPSSVVTTSVPLATATTATPTSSQSTLPFITSFPPKTNQTTLSPTVSQPTPRPVVPETFEDLAESDPMWPGVFSDMNTTHELTINIRYDDFPQETDWKFHELQGVDVKDKESWVLFDQQGAVEGIERRDFIYKTQTSLKQDTVYRFSITDETWDYSGDGICCEHGLGWASITSGASLLWNMLGNSFTTQAETYIKVDSNGHVEATTLHELAMEIIRLIGGRSASRPSDKADLAGP